MTCQCPDRCHIHEAEPRQAELDVPPDEKPEKDEPAPQGSTVTTLVSGAVAWNVLTKAGPYVLVQKDVLRVQREEPTLEGQRRAGHVVVEDAWTVHDGTRFMAVPAAMLTTAQPLKKRLSETYVSLLVSSVVSILSAVVMLLARRR